MFLRFLGLFLGTLLVGVLAVTGCTSGGKPVPPSTDEPECFTNEDCPTGFTCNSQGQCVKSGTLPDGDPDLDLGDTPDLETEFEETFDEGTTDTVDSEPTDTDAESDSEPADETDPELGNFRIVFQTPKDGDFVQQGEVNIRVIVISELPVEEVIFSVNSNEIGRDTTTPYEALWDTSQLDEGDYVIAAMARRSDGEIATATITVSIDLTPPVVNILSPEAGTMFYYDDEMLVRVEAYDHLKQLVIGIDSRPPQVFEGEEVEGQTEFTHIIPISLDTVTKGEHQLVVTATDKAGNPPTTANVPFIVDNIAPDIQVYLLQGEEWSELPPGLRELMGSQPLKVTVDDPSGFGNGSKIEFYVGAQHDPFFAEDLPVAELHYELEVRWDSFVPSEFEYPYEITIKVSAFDRFNNQSSFNRTFTVKREVFTTQPDNVYGQSPYTVYSAPALSPEESLVVAAINDTLFAATTQDGSVIWQCASPCQGAFCHGPNVYAPITVVQPSEGLSFAITVDLEGNILLHDLRSTVGGKCPYFDLADALETNPGITDVEFKHGIAVGIPYYDFVASANVLPLFLCGTKEVESAPELNRTVCVRLNFYYEQPLVQGQPAPLQVAWTYVEEQMATTTAPLFLSVGDTNQLIVAVGQKLVSLDPETGASGSFYPLGAPIALVPIYDPSTQGIFSGGGANYAHLSLNLGARDNLIAPLAGSARELSAYSSLIMPSGAHLLTAKGPCGDMTCSFVMIFELSGLEFVEDALLDYQLEMRHIVYGTPVIGADGVVYFADDSPTGVFSAVDSSTGDLLWQLEVGDRVKSPLLMDSRGVVYFTAKDGFLHAISTGSMSYATDSPCPMLGCNPQRTFNYIEEPE